MACCDRCCWVGIVDAGQISGLNPGVSCAPPIIDNFKQGSDSETCCSSGKSLFFGCYWTSKCLKIQVFRLRILGGKGRTRVPLNLPDPMF